MTEDNTNTETDQMVRVDLEVTVSGIDTTEEKIIKDRIERVLTDNLQLKEYEVVSTRVTDTYIDMGHAKGICRIELPVPITDRHSVTDAAKKYILDKIVSTDRLDVRSVV